MSREHRDMECDGKMDFGIVYDLRLDSDNPYHGYYAPIEQFDPEQTLNLVELYQDESKNNNRPPSVWDNCMKMLVSVATGEV